MEIISRGTLREETNYIITCKECGSVLRVKWKELKIAGSQYNETYYKVACPVCYKMIYVDEYQLNNDRR